MWYCTVSEQIKVGLRKSTVELKLSSKATAKSFSKHTNFAAKM